MRGEEKDIEFPQPHKVRHHLFYFQLSNFKQKCKIDHRIAFLSSGHVLLIGWIFFLYNFYIKYSIFLKELRFGLFKAFTNFNSLSRFTGSIPFALSRSI